jgi:hypothetical protein
MSNGSRVKRISLKDFIIKFDSLWPELKVEEDTINEYTRIANENIKRIEKKERQLK